MFENEKIIVVLKLQKKTSLSKFYPSLSKGWQSESTFLSLDAYSQYRLSTTSINSAMTKQKNYQYRFGGPFNLIIAVGALFLIFFIASRIISWLWQLAFFLMPFLLIATFLINRKIITGYFGMIRNLYKRNKTTGIVAGVLSVIASPLLSVIFFGQAMTQRRLKKEQTKAGQETTNKFGEYIEYEDLSTTLNLNDAPKRKTKVEPEQPPKENNSNPYDSLWE